jgi:hypothetical protein
LTGGGNYNGNQLLETDMVDSGYHRTFDSNGGIQPGAYSGFLPLIFLLNRKAGQSVAVGWDYMGHWRFEIGNQHGSPLDISLQLAGYEKDLGSRRADGNAENLSGVILRWYRRTG